MAQAKKTKTTNSKKITAAKAKTSTPASSEATVAREVLDRLQQIVDLLENLELARLTVEERQVANGRLRDGEEEVLETLVNHHRRERRCFWQPRSISVSETSRSSVSVSQAALRRRLHRLRPRRFDGCGSLRSAVAARTPR
ncbi:MAG: hypothetical protein MUF64_03175, partial [Polyangiaceae bacterium]|nr:hypothetical protein [Polyangiaceae bacterium]